MIYERLDSRLRLTIAELDQLVGAVGGTIRPPDQWHDGGVLVEGAVHPAVAAMAMVAVAPHRWTVIERFDTEQAAPTRIGWQSSGMATVTEVAGDQVTISSTSLELLPSVATQLLRLNPSRRRVGGSSITTTAGVIDDTIVAVASARRPATSSLGTLVSVLTRFVSGWRTTGGWRGRPADSTMTVLDAGAAGLWEVEYTLADGVARRSTEVGLRSAASADLLVSLGEVITGRHPVAASSGSGCSGMMS